MKIYAYAASGYAGQLVSVEVDLRRGIPGLDIVGLPDGAVRESRERVRIAIRRSGFEFPRDRILVNLSPADLKKKGAAYDLPIAMGILLASEQLDWTEENTDALLCIGELLLDGSVCAVAGVLPAVAAARAFGIGRFLVPEGNLREALTLASTGAMGISDLCQLNNGMSSVLKKIDLDQSSPHKLMSNMEFPDIGELKGQPVLKRVLEIAAAGGHHLIAFGPPGNGKTFGMRALADILPDLTPEVSLEVTRIWSQSGLLGERQGLIVRPPFREPHHSSTLEGLIGGASGKPGEVSLAHGGVLFLDETSEFGGRVLQSLREPLEARRVDMARSGRQWWYPADFQLVMAMNPCPCGNLGREEASCMCTIPEISRHWRKLGAAMLDRVDLRVPVSPVDPQKLLEPPGESSQVLRNRVERARQMQFQRYRSCSWKRNADIPAGEITRFVPLDKDSSMYFSKAVRKLGLSSRAAHGILRVARTIADMADRLQVNEDDVLEAVQHRRFGNRDIYWMSL